MKKLTAFKIIGAIAFLLSFLVAFGFKMEDPFLFSFLIKIGIVAFIMDIALYLIIKDEKQNKAVQKIILILFLVFILLVFLFVYYIYANW